MFERREDVLLTCLNLWIIFINICYGADKWEMHRVCGHHISSFGGEVTFDSSFFRGTFCQVTFVGNGTAENTALSIYFSSFNVTDGCLANVTLKEDTSYGTIRSDPVPGLFQTFCLSDPYLNPNMMFTTSGPYLTITYTKRDINTMNIPFKMSFSIKFTTFKSGVIGCSADEILNGMYACNTGRCVYGGLICRDLNPCGDHSDCSNVTKPDKGDKGGEGGLSSLKYVAIVFVVVFLIFALIQVCLTIKNEHACCHWKDPKVRLEVEVMHVPNGDVVKESPAHERLIDHNKV